MPYGPSHLRLERRMKPSARELTVLALIAEGLTTEQIGTALGLSPETAKTHARNLISKLGVRSRASAVNVGWIYGYLPHPDETVVQKALSRLSSQRSARERRR